MEPLVELEGIVEPLGTLEAPFSGRPCVLYRVELGLWQRLRDGGEGKSREEAGVTFRLRLPLEQTAVVVDATSAELRWPRRGWRRVQLGRDRATDARVARLYRRLARTGPRRRVVVGREQRLQAGDRVRLFGQAFSVPDAGGQEPPGYREPPRCFWVSATSLSVL